MAKKRIRKAAAATLFDLAADMEEPLNDIIALVRALRLTGEAMIAEANPECEPVIAVAEAAMRRLDDLGGVWTELFGAASDVKAAV